jgi:hypothetical protein
MVPIVNHPDYVAQIGDDHRFPINKFGALFQLLQQDKIITAESIKPIRLSIIIEQSFYNLGAQVLCGPHQTLI